METPVCEDGRAARGRAGLQRAVVRQPLGGASGLSSVAASVGTCIATPPRCRLGSDRPGAVAVNNRPPPFPSVRPVVRGQRPGAGPTGSRLLPRCHRPPSVLICILTGAHVSANERQLVY